MRETESVLNHCVADAGLHFLVEHFRHWTGDGEKKKSIGSARQKVAEYVKRVRVKIVEQVVKH